MKHFSKLNNEELDLLFEAILSLETKEDCYKFFEDLCTINEMASISQRMQVALMLRERKTYIDIAKATGASTATISRVNRCLNYGSEGYKLVFDKLYGNNK
ncbi:YerC/YecD family TrpR-related protein [Clostridium cylindrosporum]|uniref:Trp operon repressor family n=1 Tax=Clostridium cylindrosporum DSM 605 TaxID=1121307 RepID=A0A0J8DGB0_CLOCY|nr:YerC/YecD family TrpR-related protein [Clostridium cylindrosporum]KMT23274.1 Trp operon repressor family [Clostridium cylindrosporum DSM 605]